MADTFVQWNGRGPIVFARTREEQMNEIHVSRRRFLGAAMNPVTEKSIRDAIERGLAARGLSRVESGATLFVVDHASRTTRIDLVPFNTRAAGILKLST